MIDIGRTRIVFRVLAQSADVDQLADRPRPRRHHGSERAHPPPPAHRLPRLLWVFVFAVVYSLRADLFGLKVRKLPAQAAAPAPAAAPAGRASPVPLPPRAGPPPVGQGVAKRLVITSGAKAGLELPLGTSR